MKFLRLLLFVFSLYILPESSYSRAGEVSLIEHVKDIYSDDIISQFEEFVKINEGHVEKGNFDKTNYIFVYRPGEELDFNRTLPKEILEGDEDDWLYESRENLMPLADIYRDRLCSYNNRVHPKDNIKYQHFVIVIDLMSFYNSSNFSTVVTQLKESPKEIYFNNQVVPQDNTVINDIGFYEELKGGTLLTILWDKINMSAFDLEADRLITIAYISQDMTQLALAEKPGDITNYSVNIQVEINQQGSMFFEEWQSYTADEPPLHFKGFEIISHYIDSYIGIHYNDLEPLNLGCDQFQLYLYNDLARNYYNSKCALIDNNPKLEKFIKKATGFLDYIISARQIAISQGISEEHLNAQNFYLEYWEVYLDDLIPLFVASPQQEYQVWLSDHYQENVALGPNDFVIQSFYNSFIDITYDSFGDLKAEVERIINHLKPFSNNGYVNFVERLLSSDLGFPTAYEIELTWYSFKDILNILNSGTYSQIEKEEIFDLLRSDQDVVWHKILAFNSMGISGWGAKGKELVESLSNFVVETQLKSPNAGGVGSKYRTTKDDYNTVVWDLYSKTYTREDEVVDFLPTLKYEYTTNTITNRNTDIVANQNDIKFDFDMDVCLEWRKLFSPDPITGNDVLQDSRCSQEGPITEINIGPDVPIDMFDIVYFIDIPYPPYGDFCNDGLCDKKIGIKPAFYNYTIRHYANVEAAIFTGKVVVSSVSVFGVASKLLKAKTAAQFAINGLFVANQALSVYISLDPDGFHDNITLLVGEEYADEVTLAVTVLNTAISYYVSQNSPAAILTETPVEALKLDQVLELVALPQLALDAAAAGVPQIMSDGEIKLLSSVTEDARKHSTAFNELYNSQLYSLYGVDYSKFFEPEFAPTRANICYLRYFKGIDIAPIISTFDEAKLIKWNQDIQDDSFKDFIQDSEELDVVDNKIKVWSFAYDIEIDYSFNQLEVIFDRMMIPISNNEPFPLTASDLEDLAFSLLLIEEKLGSDAETITIFNLMGNVDFVNHYDLVPHVQILSNYDLTRPSILDNFRSFMNEYENALYWLSKGKTNVYASKEFGGDAENEIDTRFGVSGSGQGGIVECKRVQLSVSSSNWENNAYGLMWKIKDKWIKPTGLSTTMKIAFPKKYGQLRVDGSIPNWDDLDTEIEFVNYLKNHIPNIIGPNSEHIGTINELSSFEEYHILYNNKRFIIKPNDWTQ